MQLTLERRGVSGSDLRAVKHTTFDSPKLQSSFEAPIGSRGLPTPQMLRSLVCSEVEQHHSA